MARRPRARRPTSCSRSRPGWCSPSAPTTSTCCSPPVTGSERTVVGSPSMVEPVTPSEGWGCLHLFCVVGDDADRQAVLAAVKSCQEDDHQVVPFAVLGHKADLGFMAIGPDLWRLQQFQTELRAAGLDFADSYVSLTEEIGRASCRERV